MQNLSYLFIKASRQLGNKLDKALNPFDITAAQFSVIRQIQSSELITNPARSAILAGFCMLMNIPLLICLDISFD